MWYRSYFLGLIYLFSTFSYSQQVLNDSISEEPTLYNDSIINLSNIIISSKQILRSKFNASNYTGSAYYISPREIQKMGYTDINRLLRAVPGVNVYEEDGYGLRPNISLRGTKAERSEKITIMEDGVLASPAPYAAPAAYYFPNAARMHAVEVVKGNSQVQYGPFTTGGAINMVSTPIPRNFTAKLNSSYGTNNTLKVHANVGDKKNHFGYMIEYLNFGSDGFKKFENNDKAGFKRNDFISKFLLKTDRKGLNHALEFKFGYADEVSDESYVGLSETDFIDNPYLRYAGSRKDNMKTRHQQWAATYLLDINRNFKIITTGYYNKFHRNWYKLNDVRVGNTKAEKRSIARVLEDPQTNYLYYDILTGNRDYVGEALIVRANNRDYLSRGIQSKVDYDLRLGSFKVDLEMGLRYHQDQEDRFQWEDSYAIQNKEMSLFLAGIPGTQSNRVTSASALATYFLNKIYLKKLTITSGVRFEKINLLKKDYTKNDLRRTGKNRIEAKNNVSAFIPSIGINYKLIDGLSIFSGVHKGFSPPSAEEGQDPESSLNVETGIRFSNKKLTAELIGFYNDYQNMLGSNLAAGGGSGDLNQFDVGEANVKGAEFLVQFQPFNEDFFIQLPLQLSYTYTDTEIKNTFQENSWGYVFIGDEIPYINKHSVNLNIGITNKWLEANLGIRHNSDMRSKPGQGSIAENEKIPAYTILDASVNVKINKNITVFTNAINLTNKKYIVSRHPSGLRAGHPFGVFSGVKLMF